ncbi:MAG: hypothetical protein IT364_01910 [Candidatus Hydrogenedentes bacterium]|nr:hypothetical protein [Candidatus Hydrogenedentota bacterium]
MSTVEEIKRACVTKLTVAERTQLLEWLRELDDDWDHRIERDAANGKLDRLFDEADRDFESGRCKPL